MKFSFNGRDAYNMYRSIGKEIIKNYGDQYGIFEMPKFKAECCLTDNVVTGLHGFPTMAVTYFDKPTRGQKASKVMVCKAWLEYFYEDELIGLLLHEWGHVLLGYQTYDAHGATWAGIVEELGGANEEFFLPRAYNKLPPVLKNEEMIDYYLEFYGRPFYERYGMKIDTCKVAA